MKARYCSARARTENPVQIHLLPTGEFEQQIKRPFEPVDIDEEGRLPVVGRAIVLFERQIH